MNYQAILSHRINDEVRPEIIRRRVLNAIDRYFDDQDIACSSDKKLKADLREAIGERR